MPLDHGNHTVIFYASDGSDECFTDPLSIFVGKGPLYGIDISTDDLNITTDDEVQFKASGYDAVGNPIEILYELTEKGMDLRAVIEELKGWGEKYLLETS